MFEIEKNIPIPDSKKPLDFPFDKMKIGDSIVVKEEAILRRLRSALNKERYKNPDRSFIVRTIGKEWRCWRIR